MIQPVSAKITHASEVTPWAHLVWLEAPEIARAARPGQFVMVGCGPDTTLRRPFSLHRVDLENGRIAVLFNVVGKGTEWLAARGVGETTDLLGPLGNGFSVLPETKSILLASGRIGIAPLSFLCENVIQRNISVLTLNGMLKVNDKDHRPYPSQLWPVPDGLIIATEDGSMGRKGKVTDILPEYIKDADQIIACGPMPMYRTMSQMPELKGKSVQISLELRMACGVGACYGCTLPTRQGLKRVCKDGPVFALHDVLWDDPMLAGC
ncbi:dihydroorotate dehydrogenase electron transfer subunit [Chloroflexota bacterium]